MSSQSPGCTSTVAASMTGHIQRVALVGTGLVGTSWAIVFARAGKSVQLYDSEPATLEAARVAVNEGLHALERAGLLVESPSTIAARLSWHATLEAALEGVDYVQESIVESLEAKRSLFGQLDVMTSSAVILASSTSSFATSAWAESLMGRSRCLVAHPVNPPHLIPFVEISGAPFTSATVLETTLALQREIGQAPVLLHKEVAGFVLNRLQWTLLAEAYRLVADGVVDAEGIDQAIREGLGRRWAFMGPFEVGDLNAPNGVADYFQRFGATIAAIDASRRGEALQLQASVIEQLQEYQRGRWPDSDPGLRRRRLSERDEQLLQLAAWRRQWASSQ